jgi:hypothetical protein
MILHLQKPTIIDEHHLPLLACHVGIEYVKRYRRGESVAGFQHAA